MKIEALRKPSDIRADMDELQTKVDSILAKATEEGRQLSKEEEKEVDALIGKGRNDGKLHELVSELDRSMRNEERIRVKVIQTAKERWPEKFGGKSGGNGSILRAHDGREIRAYGRNDKLGNANDLQELGTLVSAMIAGQNGRLSERVSNALTGRSNGGDLALPVEFSNAFLDLARAKSVMVANGAQTMQMDSPEVVLVSVLNDPTISERTELATMTASNIALGRVRLQSRTYATMIELSREEFEDSPNAGDMVVQVLAQAMAKKIDYLGLMGSGSQEPSGLAYHGSINATGSISSLAWDEVSAAATAVRGRNHEPNACVLNTSIRDGLLITKDSYGRWLEKPPTLTNVNMDATTSLTSSIGIVGDFTKCVFGIRSGVSLEATQIGSDTFEKHGVKIKAVWRGDFGVLYPDAFQRLEGIS